jgi:hypothetical protein
VFAYVGSSKNLKELKVVTRRRVSPYLSVIPWCFTCEVGIIHLVRSTCHAISGQGLVDHSHALSPEVL